jgi:hypothetical protein
MIRHFGDRRMFALVSATHPGVAEPLWAFISVRSGRAALAVQPEQLDLSAILDALSDPVSRSIVLRLAEYGSANCSNSYDMGSKISLTGHHTCIADRGQQGGAGRQPRWWVSRSGPAE